MRSEKYDFENISVNGKSKVTVKPDSAKIKFKIKKHDEILASAKDNVDSRSKLMIEKCLSLGVSRESQKSSNITVKPYREWSGGSGYTMKGYEVSREIEIAIQEIDKFNEVIQMLIDVPINEITEIKMESSSIDLYKKLATQEAVSDAKDKAKYLCDQFDIEL
ncbi:MAG: SIMPL domain-containing protein [Candidatus Thiodiazotropha sp.]